MILQQSLLYAWKKQFHTVLGLQGVCPCKLSEFFQKSGQVLIKLLAVHTPKPDVILGAVHREVPCAMDGDGQNARRFVRVRQIDREAVDFFPDAAVCLIRAFKQDIAVQNLQKSFLFFCIRADIFQKIRQPDFVRTQRNCSKCGKIFQRYSPSAAFKGNRRAL